jgi:hypothetical protein
VGSTPVNLGGLLGVGQGAFVGSRARIFDVQQVTGPNSYQPGFTMEGGWKFQDGTALTVSWLYLSEGRFNAAVTQTNNAVQQFGANDQNSFLTSFVFNFPSQYAGPFSKVTVPTNQLPTSPNGAPFIPVGGVYGIWNGASVMTEEFVQRTEQIEATYRFPFYETECYRISGLVGPRFFWIWERYRWRTTDIGLVFDTASSLPVAAPDSPEFVAVYNNIVSNRMYGVKTGVSQEWYIGRGFAAMLDTQVCLFLDVVREKVNYQLGDKMVAPQAKRAKTQYQAVPEFQATPRLMWYAWEGIQFSIGYDLMAFFNTISSPRPIDFNYGSLTPGYESTFRFYDGFQAQIALVF